jgi:hypothetical protein
LPRVPANPTAPARQTRVVAGQRYPVTCFRRSGISDQNFPGLPGPRGDRGAGPRVPWAVNDRLRHTERGCAELQRGRGRPGDPPAASRPRHRAVSTQGCPSRPSAGASATPAPRPPSCWTTRSPTPRSAPRAAGGTGQFADRPCAEQAQRNRVYLATAVLPTPADPATALTRHPHPSRSSYCRFSPHLGCTRVTSERPVAATPAVLSSLSPLAVPLNQAPIGIPVRPSCWEMSTRFVLVRVVYSFTWRDPATG